MGWRRRIFQSYAIWSVKLTKDLILMGFPGGSGMKNLTAMQELQEMLVWSGLGRSLGGGHGNPLQYSCLENPVDRGAWQATVHRVTKTWTQLKWLSTHIMCIHFKFSGSTYACVTSTRGKRRLLQMPLQLPSSQCHFPSITAILTSNPVH